jgi:hypothetical protein
LSSPTPLGSTIGRNRVIIDFCAIGKVRWRRARGTNKAAWHNGGRLDSASSARLASLAAFPYRLALRAVFPTPLEAKGALFF